VTQPTEESRESSRPTWREHGKVEENEKERERSETERERGVREKERERE
jgi:hypothetical protein